MKIQLIIDLDLPETCEGLGLDDLTELLNDVQVNHAVVAHRWMAANGLVQHQDVGRLREQLCQQQTVALTAGEMGDRSVDPVG